MSIRPSRPLWVDSKLYPFGGGFHETLHGRIHYVDEGAGPPVLMLHGNPTWSFEYRHLIRGLAGAHRCIVPDHLGFGLSDKPWDVEYTAALHGRNVEHLVDALGLEDLVIMGGDWGGPIGLSYAVRHPERVRAVVLFNTWAWPIGPFDFHQQTFSRIVGGPLGRYLIRRYGLFVERVLPAAFGRRELLTSAVMTHYRCALAHERDRKACWSFPGQIVGAGEWLAQIWSQRDLFRHLPFLVLWGEKDPAFRLKELARWRRELTHAEIEVLPGVGHFVAEEAATEILPRIRRFLKSLPARGRSSAPLWNGVASEWPDGARA